MRRYLNFKFALILFCGMLIGLSPAVVNSASRSKVEKKRVTKKKYIKKKRAHRKTLTKSQRKQIKKKKVKNSLYAWLEKMKKRVSRSHAKHNQLVSVASVRGAKTSDAPPLYWKGKKSEGPVDLPEIQEFEKAINSAMKGDSKSATNQLNAFKSKYPNSSLNKDVDHTLAMLNPGQKRLAEPSVSK